MANTSDGNKGDPPDPPKAHMTIDALPSDPPSVYRAKNDSIPPDTDQEMLNASLPFYPPARPSDHDHDQDQDNTDMEFDALANNTPDVAFYDTDDGTANADADAAMIVNPAETADSTDDNIDNNDIIHTTYDTDNKYDTHDNNDNRLAYSTDSEWNSSPWNIVSSRKSCSSVSTKSPLPRSSESSHNNTQHDNHNY